MDGSLDTTFGTDGKVITAVRDASEFSALSIQSDGKIIAAGSSMSMMSPGIFLPGLTGSDFGLVRYNEDGSLDMTFGAQGQVTSDLNTQDQGSRLEDGIRSVLLQPDGKIIATGDSRSYDEGPRFGLARYNRDGSLDPTFGAGGKFRMQLPRGQFAYARFAGIQPDGKILVAGGGEIWDEFYEPYSTSIELARFTTTGLQIVTAVQVDPAIIRVGDSWKVTFSGSNLTDQTHFDVRFRSPDSTTDQEALNWQQGTSARHEVPAGTEPGIWTVTGIRAHESVNDHGGEFMPISVFLTVTGG
jgi:uncharacterized delta-60 repeat protein